MLSEIKLKISQLQKNNFSNDGDILTDPEAAIFLKVSQMTLLRWRNAGLLGFYRPAGGRRVTYSKSKHLLPFLDACEQTAKR